MQKQSKPRYIISQVDMYRAMYDAGSYILACEPHESKADCEKQAIADFGAGNFKIETLPVGSRILVY